MNHRLMLFPTFLVIACGGAPDASGVSIAAGSPAPAAIYEKFGPPAGESQGRGSGSVPNFSAAAPGVTWLPPPCTVADVPGNVPDGLAPGYLLDFGDVRGESKVPCPSDTKTELP